MTAILERSASAAFERSAPRVAVVAAALAGFEVTGAVTTLSLGTNGVFELATPTGSIIARVARPGRARELVAAEMSLAGWLADVGFPVCRPAVTAPIECAGWLTSLWEKLDGEEAQPADAAEVGELLRRFHELTDDYPGLLRDWNLLGDLRRRLDDPGVGRFVTAGELTAPREALANLYRAASSRAFGLGPGIIHGDLHWGNVMCTEAGAVLIDFDRVTWGPREWDVLPLFFSRGRPLDVDPDVADAFVEGFGWDPRGRPDFNSFVEEVRELATFTWLLQRPYTPALHRHIQARLTRWTERRRQPRWV